MKKVYLAGYGKMRSVDELVALVDQLMAEVIDIRISPASRKPGFRGSNLNRVLVGRYAWAPSLGNVNYKGGPIQIHDMEDGIRFLAAADSSVLLLLCACSDPAKCHRTIIGDELRRRGGYEVIEVSEMEAAND